MARTAEGAIFTPGGDRKANAFNNVVFPAPELPNTANISPPCAIPLAKE